jgi:hypothetical protein
LLLRELCFLKGDSITSVESLRLIGKIFYTRALELVFFSILFYS